MNKFKRNLSLVSLGEGAHDWNLFLLFLFVGQAVELDTMEADQQTTSMLDDVFFIVKKCVNRLVQDFLFFS